MDEFWVCQHCRSLNRAGSGKCYSCRKKYGSRPKESDVVVPTAGAATPPARPGASPGVAPVQTTYFSRPVALASAAAPAGQIAQVPRGRFHVPNPVAATRRRVAWWLAMRQSISVDWLGYVIVALLALVLLTGAVVVMTAMPAAASLLQHADPGSAWAQLTAGQQASLETVSVAFAVMGLLALVCFSVFLGLTTHNAPGLGADLPLLTPYRAGTSWAGAIWAQARIAVGLAVPPALIWQGYVIPGLLAAVVAVEIAQRHVDDPAGWLTRPSRHVPDLYDKLGVEGSMSAPIASIWSACFRAANSIAIAVAALPWIALGVFVASVMAGRSDTFGWQSNGLGLIQVAVALLLGCLVGFGAASLLLLALVSIGLVRRQRTRRTLVRVGRSRSWAGRPGERGYVLGSQGEPADYGDIDEDRIVERVPRYGAQTYESPDAGIPGFNGPHHIDGPGLGGPRQDFGSPGPGLGGPGFGAPGPGLGGSPFAGPPPSAPGPGFVGPDQGVSDQASLNSPSTTSSAPESGEPAAPSE